MTNLIADFDALVARQWDDLASPGAWWSGEDSVAIAAEARMAGDDLPSTATLPAAAREATRRVATEAHTIRSVDIERWADLGLDVHAYVELVGIVSRLAAIDAAAFGLGLDRPPLPRPRLGGPSHEIPDGVSLSDGWVPTRGRAFPPNALTAVPGATEVMFDAHGVLYLSLEEMGDLAIVRDGITRPQMELVAARTSKLNDCFY